MPLHASAIGSANQNFALYHKLTKMTSLHITVAVAMAAVICTVHAAPAKVQNDQTATDQKVAEAQLSLDLKSILYPVFARHLGNYATNRFSNGKAFQENQAAKSTGFWDTVDPTLLKEIVSYVGDHVTNGEEAETAENQEEAEAQLFGTLALLGSLIAGAISGSNAG